MTALKKLWARIQRHRPYTAYTRYADANGDLLAAGVGYYSFFSVFPAVALAFATLGFVLEGRPELVDTIAKELNQTFPNMVRTAGNPDGIIGVSAPSTVALTITGIVAFFTLLFTGLGWIGALRTGIRGIYGLDASPDNPVKTKVRDLGVLVILGFGVALSAVTSSGASAAGGWVTDELGIRGAEWLITLVGILIGVVFDTAIMVVLLRVLPSVPLPWHNVRNGAIFGGVMLTALKVFGTRLVAMISDNPLLGAVAVAVGLLFWLNLMARIVLLSAAWAAIHVDIERLLDDDETGPFARAARPAFVAPLTARVDATLVPYGGAAPRGRVDDASAPAGGSAGTGEGTGDATGDGNGGNRRPGAVGAAAAVVLTGIGALRRRLRR